jgi:2-methylcitrate dehydratase
VVKENPQFTKDYFDADKRYIGNAIQVFFKDGSSTDKVSIDYPIGHRKRRAEGIPVLMTKAKAALGAHLPAEQAAEIMRLAAHPAEMDAMPLSAWMALFSA